MKLAADPSPVTTPVPIRFQPADKTASCGQNPETQTTAFYFSFSKQNLTCQCFLKSQNRKERKEVFPSYLSLLPTPTHHLPETSLEVFLSPSPSPRTCHPRLTGSLHLPTALQLTSGGASLPGLFLTALIEAGIPLTFTLPHHYQLQASSSQAKKASQSVEWEGLGMKCQQLCTDTTASWGAVPHLPTARPTLPSLTMMGGGGGGGEE